MKRIIISKQMKMKRIDGGDGDDDSARDRSGSWSHVWGGIFPRTRSKDFGRSWLRCLLPKMTGLLITARKGPDIRVKMALVCQMMDAWMYECGHQNVWQAPLTCILRTWQWKLVHSEPRRACHRSAVTGHLLSSFIYYLHWRTLNTPPSNPL